MTKIYFFGRESFVPFVRSGFVFGVLLSFATLFGLRAQAQGFESFDTYPYNSTAYTASVEWTGVESVAWSVAPGARNGVIDGVTPLVGSNGKNGLTVGGTLLGTGFKNGLGTLKFKYKKAFTAASTIAVYVNDTEVAVLDASSDVVADFSKDVNVDGDFALKFVTTERTLIDNVEWTAYGTSSGGGSTGAVANLSLSPNVTTTAEASSASFVLTATLSKAVSSATWVDLQISGTGITSGDYTCSATALRWNAGETVATADLAIVNDTEAESSEVMTIKLANPVGISLGTTTTLQLTITDDDTQSSGAYGTPLHPTYGKVSSTAPGDLYYSLDGKSGDNLKATLQTIVVNSNTHAHVYGDIWAICEEADENPENTNEVWLIYKEVGMPKADHVSGSYGWNREHVFPQSRGGFTDGTSTTPDGIDVWVSTSANNILHAHADGHHLRASDNVENSNRGNLDFDYVSGARTKDANFYEPPNSSKGDVARALMYMAVRYNGLSLIAGLGSGSAMGNLTTLLEWNTLDPVDDYEMHRNNAVYRWQNNRNPFIDHPELADYIFGDKKTETYNLSGGTNGLIVSGGLVDFGVVLNGNTSAEQTISVSGSGLTADVTISAPEHFKVALEGGQFQSQLTLSPTSNELASTVIRVVFAPTATVGAVVSGNISIVSADFSKSIAVQGTEGDPALQPQRLLWEDFESTTHENWKYIATTGDRLWGIKDFSANHYMQMSAYSTTATSKTEYDTWLISPEVNLFGYTDVKFSFTSKNGYYKGTALRVYISTNFDGADPLKAQWVELTEAVVDENPNTAYGATFIPSGDVSLAAYSGPVYIAFRYTGDTEVVTTTYQVDDIEIEAVPVPVNGSISLGTTTEITFDNVPLGSYSDAKSYQITYSGSVGSTTLNSGNNFLISLDGTNWSKEQIIAEGTASPVTVYVKAAPIEVTVAGLDGEIVHMPSGAEVVRLPLHIAASPNYVDASGVN